MRPKIRGDIFSTKADHMSVHMECPEHEGSAAIIDAFSVIVDPVSFLLKERQPLARLLGECFPHGPDREKRQEGIRL